MTVEWAKGMRKITTVITIVTITNNVDMRNGRNKLSELSEGQFVTTTERQIAKATNGNFCSVLLAVLCLCVGLR